RRGGGGGGQKLAGEGIRIRICRRRWGRRPEHGGGGGEAGGGGGGAGAARRGGAPGEDRGEGEGEPRHSHRGGHRMRKEFYGSTVPPGRKHGTHSMHAAKEVCSSSHCSNDCRISQLSGRRRGRISHRTLECVQSQFKKVKNCFQNSWCCIGANA
ncbi:Os01g0256800, partial [Oryza sativa Japonica Group]